MASAPYPAEFYIAHKLFTGPGFGFGGAWGDITDGPADTHDLREVLGDHFPHQAPDRTTLRIWHFPGDASARDVTEDIITQLSDIWPADGVEAA